MSAQPPSTNNKQHIHLLISLLSITLTHNPNHQPYLQRRQAQKLTSPPPSSSSSSSSHRSI
ncbi:hypothetical protein PGT21_035035 [Puccinia graminis f. sp. tritici]|uniref:Uncharacterized protein n=1 Tax=Puccinia graminis f. sp. tritici TaxID=56615 RepID=A0A5B0QPR6_PUCGR|nr:hypothetical protein PGT21_035035 [Puccinia graminis f. sp. tritici]